MFKRNTNCRIPDLREHGKKQLGEAFSANQQKMPPNIGILSGLLPEIYKVWQKPLFLKVPTPVQDQAVAQKFPQQTL